MHKLTSIQREVLELRFGLGANEPLTLVEVSKQVGVSRECVRQHERRALRKILDLNSHQAMSLKTRRANINHRATLSRVERYMLRRMWGLDEYSALTMSEEELTALAVKVSHLL